MPGCPSNATRRPVLEQSRSIPAIAECPRRDTSIDTLVASDDTSMAARLEPLFIVISTQSNDPLHPLSILIDDALRSEDKTTVCHLYAVPDDAEGIFDDPKVWRKANPALGDFRSLSEMRTAAQRAKRRRGVDRGM